MADLLEMRGISKSFGRNKVLADVNFSVRAGEVHALCGENGAGKSTLVKILAGIYQPDTGEIVFGGEKRIFNETMEAQKAGISIIHQELMLMPHLSIAENIVSSHSGKLWAESREGRLYVLAELPCKEEK